MENVFTTFFDLSKKGQENSVNSVNCVKPLIYQTLPSKNETEERDGYYERTVKPVGKSRITSTRPGLNQDKTPITKMLQRVAMIFCVLVLSVGQVWGETYTWSFANGSGTISGTTTNFTSTSGNKILIYDGGSSCGWGGDSGDKYLKMGGKSSYSNETPSDRFFKFLAPSSSGTVSISYAGSVANTEISAGSNGSLVWDVITPTANETSTSKIISGLTAGSTYVYISCPADKSYIKSITWTDAALPYERVYYSEMKTCVWETALESGASFTAHNSAIGFNGKGGSGWNSYFSNYLTVSSSGGYATATFSPALTLTSNGVDKGRIRVYFSGGSKNLSLEMNGNSAGSYNSVVNYRTYVAEYTIPDATTNLSTLKMYQSNNSGIVIFAIEVLTYSSSTWYLPGSWYNDFERANAVKFTGSPLTLTLHLDEHTSYDFKLVKNNGSETWYDNSGGKVITTMRDWSIAGTSDGANSVLFTGPEGDYTFTLDPETKSLDINYPNIHPDDNYMYFENTDVWGTVGAYIYSNESWKVTSWDGTPSLANSTVEICGHTYHYCVTPRYSNGGTFENVIFRNLANSGQSSARSAKKESHGGKWSDNNSATIHEFNLYTISFDAGDGTGTMSAIEGLCPGDDPVLPANTFTRTGYTFNGWKTNVAITANSAAVAADGAVAAGATINDIATDITLTAQWTPIQYDVTLEKGTADAAPAGNSGSAKVLYDAAALTNITHATWTGHVLTGYFTSNTSGTKVLNADGSFAASTVSGYITDNKWTRAENTTLKAQWTCIDFTPGRGGTSDGTYTVGENGGTLTCSVAEAGSYTYQWKQYTSGQTEGDAVNAVGTGATTASFTPHPTVAGTYYYFCSVTNGCGTTKNCATSGTFTFNAAVTTHTVTYNANGGSCGTSSETAASVTLPTPTWSGYTFEGWYNAGTRIGGAGDSYSPEEDIILYAHWTDNTDGKLFSYIDNNYGDKFKGFDGETWVTGGGSDKDKTYTNGTTGVQFVVDDGAWDNKTNQTASAISSMVKFVKDKTTASIVIPDGKTATVKILYGSYDKDNKKLTVGGSAQNGPKASFDDAHTNAVLLSSDMREITLTDQTGTITLGSSSGNIYIARVSAVITSNATISATKTSPDYVTTAPGNVQLNISVTGASTGWYYRVKNIGKNGYETPDKVTYTTTSWTMTSGLSLGVNNFVVELYNGSDVWQASSSTITVTAETAYPMTIVAGANGSVSPSSVNANETANHIHPEITATPASGYHFVNWTLDNANATLENANSATTTITNAIGECTITANFAADVVGHTVTFNYNGATSGASPASATGASVTLPKPTRTDYTFDGWYTTAGEKVGNGDATYEPEADITLYARWQEACDAEGVAKSTTDVAATEYTAYQEVGGSNVVFTSTPTLGFKYKDADGNPINNSTTDVVRNNAYSCKIQSSSSNKGAIKTNNAYSNVDSISFYFAGTDKAGCKVAVWCSTDDFSADSTQLLPATAVASPNSNKEFTRKVIAIPSGQKASALRFKFRFTADGSGKTCYIDSLKVYSSTTGGSTCYHVYYHGNGAESGYVNDTVSYTAGSKATVLNYNYGRYPLTKDGYDFQGWATSADGAVAYTAGEKIDITSADVDLYAVWAAESSALVTWTMNLNTSTWGAASTSTTGGTNISSIGTARTNGSDGARDVATAKVTMATAEVAGSAAPSNSANFTFTIAGGKQVEISKFDCQVFNVASGNRTYKAQISDAAGNVYNSTNTVAVSAEATLTDASFVFGSEKILRGDVTIRIYAWKTSGSPTEFRMGPDIKFYGTVEDYVCADPSAPTISGVSAYVPGETITLTASHDGENYDNLTTYTWYKGADWATASGSSPVQAANTGEEGYTLTIDDCTTGNDLYWCKVSNGTCNAHNSEGYNVIVYPTYTITYNLDGGTNPVDPAPKTSYTQFDEDYTLPTPTKTGYVFAGWYGASDFSGLPTVVLGAGSVGNKEYYAKWGASVTVSWTVTKRDDKLYRGGGGYSVKAVIDQTAWSRGFMDELELTATEGVTLKNIEVSENDESKVQVTADFDITTDLAADATSITFTLNVPADGTYGPKVDKREEDLENCAGSGGVVSIFDGTTATEKTDEDGTSYKEGIEHTDPLTGFKYTCKGVKNDLYTSSMSNQTGNGKTYSAGLRMGGSSSSSDNYIELKVPVGYTADLYIVNGGGGGGCTFGVSATAGTVTTYHELASRTISSSGNYYLNEVSGLSDGTYYILGSSDKLVLGEITVTLTPLGGGGSGPVTPTLTWTPTLASDGDWDSGNNRLNKETGDPDFTFVANQNKNSLGAITYESSDETVATVNATTGKVHIVGAEGTATITATLAASGCFDGATAAYTINVVDNCIDVPGTISTTDRGCSGIEMTVSGHTTSGETVSYQWYKVGTPDEAISGATEATYTATDAGEYYVVVTNTGTDHCPMASTNTIKVAAKAAISVPTNIVDSWYVKNGRRTPDIALWKTTGVSTFTVKNNDGGATIENIGGCTFELKDGIIYLKGTTSTGAAPSGMEAGDLVIKVEVKDKCGSNTKTSSTITIHRQEATAYKEIAFVADGGKGMKKDSITVGHGDGTELYEYLDSVKAAGNRLFRLSERNIYWTTDEKTIREEYSQFDGILITDDPSTNTVVTTGDDYKTKGYVNAFGTMVDVRPIFTMEAYVSALTNWGSKGIKGNPQSPNPRQYEMRLECKDHEIYGAGLPDPEDGTNVWEETIGGETFRHVILVDSTKGVYKGVKYNKETKGNEKPALQGFTGEAAGSLLGLGRILEGTLQAAIERQEEPAARLLVMGINAKALQPTCALTNEGKTVIKNILIYLLKTNMEEVDDCSNYFTGKIDSDWKKAENWSKNQLPSSEAKVRILAPCVISGIKPHVLQVSIVNSGNSNIRYTATSNAVCNGTLTIEPDGALIADGKIRSAVAPHFAANDLKPTTPEMLTINTGSDGQAALIFNNDEASTKATVNYYSLGRKKDGAYQFQYFAVPMEYVDVNPAFAGSGIYTYAWHENGGWERRGYYTELYAFEGLGITTKFAESHTYTMKGTLASTAERDITLTANDEGDNIIGNSWMAPINIASLKTGLEGDANVDKTVYIYCTGNDKADGDDDVDNSSTETAGQWLAIPIDASGWSGWSGLKVIPAMQAFLIHANAETTLTLNYKDHVRSTEAAQLNEPLRAPHRTEARSDDFTGMRMSVADSQTHTDLYLFEGEQFSADYDNGWEAKYMEGDGRSAQFYAMNGEDKMAVMATNELEGTYVGFAPGKESNYTISFFGGEGTYYLNDLKEEQSTAIEQGNTYSFTYEQGDMPHRFLISTTPFGIPSVTTGVGTVEAQEKVQKVIYNDHVYIIRGGKIYDVMGKMMK